MNRNERKILIIEDEKYLLEMYQSRFEKSGHQVLTAANGRTGLKLAQRERPNLIILDILMPTMDGFEVVKKIRADSQLKKIPILILSNLGQPDEIKEGLRLGADDYVIKTDLTPSELLEKAERMLDRRGASIKTKKRVLIIEDELDIAELYRAKLSQAGFEVEMADNGALGLRLANHGDFDIILLDMVMPALDGYQALKQLKDDSRTKEVPVLVFSNSIREEEINQALKLGARNYFIKSKVTPAQVIEEVKKILK